MPQVGVLARTPVGKAAAATLAVTILYVTWLLGFPHEPENERWVSAFCLNLSYILFVWFGIRMLQTFPFKPQLRKSWMLLIAATASLAIGEVIYVMSGKPAISAAELFYLAYYVLYILGILSFPFVPVSRRERTLLMLDLFIVLTAALSLLWYALANSVLNNLGSHSYSVLANLVYPALDFLIVGCAVVIIQRDVEGLHPLTLLCIAVGKGFAAIADAMLVYGWLKDSVAFEDLYSATFAVERFLVFLGIAFQIAALQQPGQSRASSYAKRIARDALPYLATFIILALLTVALITHESLDVSLRGALFGTMALIAIVLYRQYIVLKENVSLYEEATSAREQAEKATKAKAEFLA